MSFNTKATTREGVLQDLSSFMTSRMGTKGLIPPSAGITRPASDRPVTSAEDLLGQFESWGNQNALRRGGAAYDMLDTPTAETYRARRYDFISREEGLRHRAYDDATGKPITDPSGKKGLVTVGVGFNMDRPEARDVFKKALGTDEHFDAVYSGKRALNDDEVQKIFDVTVQEAESYVANKFKDVPLKEHQRLALVSIAFNNPSLIGPITTQRIRSGDMQGAISAILEGMNKKKVRGLASRRWREAEMFAGGDATIPDYRSYMGQFA